MLRGRLVLHYAHYLCLERMLIGVLTSCSLDASEKTRASVSTPSLNTAKVDYACALILADKE